MARNVYKRYKKNIDKLILTYPHLFDKVRPVPLAIGIYHQIVADGQSGLSNTEIHDCLRIWCQRIEYNASMRHSKAIRRNLNGTEAEPVSDEHKARAARVHDAKRHKEKKLKKALKAGKCYKQRREEGRLKIEPLKAEDATPDF